LESQMSDLSKLIDLLYAAHSGRVDPKAFVGKFDSVYWNLSDREVSGDSRAWLAINGLAEQLEYFDPANQDEPGLFGETKLRELIGEALIACRLNN
uniref:hypothetical protein n=1 Tax=Arsukibacterium sp. TaxID=1977258 RepID=UPI002FD8845B